MLVVTIDCGHAQHEINVRSQELSEKTKKEKIRSALTKRKREEREAVASGKNPFYLKVRPCVCVSFEAVDALADTDVASVVAYALVQRKDKKKLELQTKFQDLQESGKLSKFMAKKRKKNASKDHRWLPTQRKT